MCLVLLPTSCGYLCLIRVSSCRLRPPIKAILSRAARNEERQGEDKTQSQSLHKKRKAGRSWNNRNRTRWLVLTLASSTWRLNDSAQSKIRPHDGHEILLLLLMGADVSKPFEHNASASAHRLGSSSRSGSRCVSKDVRPLTTFPYRSPTQPVFECTVDEWRSGFHCKCLFTLAFHSPYF